jgi:SAM-dependent methyltransferase
VTGARSRAIASGCQVRFSVGDAVALDEPDGYFDAVRSERTLQWITDPEAAVAEMARVLRPGGHVSLIDTDWSTFAIDVGDDDLAGKVRKAMRIDRARPSKIGSRLPELVRSCGFEVVAQTASTQSWNGWNPDESPAPHGCFSMSSFADNLIETGQLSPTERQGFVSTIHQAARDGRFTMALTMFAVIARVPKPAG